MQVKSEVLVFPGQGSQRPEMGRNLYENFAVAKEIFHRVDEALHFKLSNLIFEGEAEELNKTSHAQPAIMATSMAYYEVLKEKELIVPDNIKFMAGHSLGEYTALCAAGALSLEDTAILLQARGAAMMQACLKNRGAMAALIGIDFDTARKIADDTDCYVGNSNTPAQIVLSGTIDAIEKVCQKAKDLGVKRFVILPVSGAFHSPLMQSAADEMESVLERARITVPKVEVISNLTARPYEDSSEIKKMLVEQITHTVKWQESIVYMASMGASHFVEIGFGEVLKGLIRKILPEAEVVSSDELLQQI